MIPSLGRLWFTAGRHTRHAIAEREAASPLNDRPQTTIVQPEAAAPLDDRARRCPMSHAAKYEVAEEIISERVRQDRTWGEQNHPDGTGGDRSATAAVGARLVCKLAARNGTLTWRDVLREEVAEAFAETDPAKLRAELVQVSAVAACWVEAIDRRTAADRAAALAHARVEE